MKFFKTIIAVYLMVFMYQAAWGAEPVNLRWDASTGEVDGYNIYFTDITDDFNYDAGNATEVLDIVNTLNLHPGTTYTFTATAYNQMGESAESNSATYTTPDVYAPPGDNIPIRLTRPSLITIIVE